jgi:hypothetical protein
MSRQRQLLGMRAMLDHVAAEAGKSGYALVSTLAAAASEAAKEELVQIARPRRKVRDADERTRLMDVEAEENYAYAASDARPR